MLVIYLKLVFVFINNVKFKCYFGNLKCWNELIVVINFCINYLLVIVIIYWIRVLSLCYILVYIIFNLLRNCMVMISFWYVGRELKV